MERIRSTTLSERIVPSGLPSELSALAVTFNEMLDRLEESFGRLARFSGDIAHELRTPVNNLRGEAEVALGRPRSPEEYREVLGSCLEECGRLSRLIDSMLFLARADSSASWITPQPVNIGRELEAIREFYQEVASEGGVTLVVAPGDTIMANADRTLFQRAIGNLVANALAHTPSGGRVTLAGTTVGQNVCVEVADTGSGIPAEDLPHIFEPFYRADRARSTFSGRVGLGLAIVSSIARLHRGSVTIDSQVGQGTRVRLVVPSGRSSPPCPVDS
jgi:two-component system heavy metal sensor histidine kinase CusS